jgi:hypothetical protein
VVGNPVADLIEPALTAVVNWGYPNNDPLGPQTSLQPARLVPRPQETATFIRNLADGVKQGVQSTESQASERKSTPLTNVVKTTPKFTPATKAGDTASTSAGTVKPGVKTTAAQSNTSSPTAQPAAPAAPAPSSATQDHPR